MTRAWARIYRGTICSIADTLSSRGAISDLIKIFTYLDANLNIFKKTVNYTFVAIDLNFLQHIDKGNHKLLFAPFEGFDLHVKTHNKKKA